MKKLSKKSVLLLGASGVLAVGIAVPAVAYAEDATPSPSTSSSASPGTVKQRGPDQQKLAAALAKELGIDEQKVADALTKVRDELRPTTGDKPAEGDQKADRAAKLKERLDQAVKDGKLTQAEADAIIKAQSAGVLGGPGFGGRVGHGPAPTASPTK
ncbi:hypothetical protein F4553_000580 [Allocatelliglobosispora scoriae]|uniref:Uncharacterized protein n=1 Tax=Allocatelliglobosispora scoriae TaxID=643052 RepID=A0A841BJY0_9ACTN|nr:hypothetical protein [Allocatelliglobosispora scoriae]MBB5867201.1 hypothetical protein [Allocatelliglobosispora scoriae]